MVVSPTAELRWAVQRAERLPIPRTPGAQAQDLSTQHSTGEAERLGVQGHSQLRRSEASLGYKRPV